MPEDADTVLEPSQSGTTCDKDSWQCHLVVAKPKCTHSCRKKMAAISAKTFYSHSRDQSEKRHISTSRIEGLLQSFVENNTEVEDLSDCDVADPGVELSDSTSSTNQQSSDESAELQRSNGPVRKRKRGPSPEKRQQHWKSIPFVSDLLPFEAEDESAHERQHWQPLDYMSS
ncbi:hypothetical protein G5714_004401 [Onychostoma macrolepis]|uniref:Uncharacterized protein n=1 Tax=Onychostoma macrolepis TaxID=369639 RepID=A0A7J6D4L4_9TELE|nr:hypothetical protein G5714_004401 [Onychostoma macrolepis]